jgi:hypothetical protein
VYRCAGCLLAEQSCRLLWSRRRALSIARKINRSTAIQTESSEMTFVSPIMLKSSWVTVRRICRHFSKWRPFLTRF